MKLANRLILSAACTVLLPVLSEAASIGYRGAVLADGATAYYEFDEAIGTIASDTAGGDNSGSLVGSVSFGASSAYEGLNTSALFSGGAIRIPDAATFDLGTGAFSLEMWFFTTSEDRGDLFTYKGGAGDFGIHSNSQGDPAGFTGSTSVYLNDFRASPAGADTGVWHHFAVTRDGLGVLSHYIDGNLRGSTTNSDSLDIPSDLLIGSNRGGTIDVLSLPFAGNIDEVAWYPVALSKAQIDNHIALAQVPEPSSALLLMGAGLLLGARRSRRLTA